MISKQQNDIEQELCIAVKSLIAMGIDRNTIQRQIDQAFEEVTVKEAVIPNENCVSVAIKSNKKKTQSMNVKFKSKDSDEIMTVKICGPNLCDVKVGQFDVFLESFKKHDYVVINWEFE
jgi:hypothetical protein